MLIAFVAGLIVLALGGAGLVYAGGAREKQQKRLAAVAKPQAQLRGVAGGDPNIIKRKNIQQLLKQIENKTAAQKQKITTRRRLDQAGLPNLSASMFWIASGALGAVVAL